MELRNYQIDAIEQIEGHMMFDTSPCCLAAPTSFGKTITSAHLIKDLVASDRHVVFLVNLTSLISQTSKTLDALDIKYNVVAASYKGAQHGPMSKVTIAMQQTLSSRLDDMSAKGTLPKCDVLIVDEMHISHDTQTMNDVKDALRPNNIIGLSATPMDAKGGALKNVRIIETQTTKQLTDDNHLAFANTMILKYAQALDFSTIGSGEDYTDPEIDGLLNNQEYNKAVVDGWMHMRNSINTKTIVFVSTVSHAETLAKQFRTSGIDAKEYHSGMSAKDRERAMHLFRINTHEVMVSVNSLIAGFDMTDIQCGIMCRPTKRARTYLQAVGRILRKNTKSQSEEVAWIDAAKITSEHGLYDEPYKLGITDRFELKKYKESRKEPYITKMCADNEAKHFIRVTESSLKAYKKTIESDTSLDGLMARYDASNDIKQVLNIGFQIAQKLGQPATIKTLHFVKETCVPYVEEGGSLKAIKTRMRNIIKDGKKLAALHYFPKWLKEQNWN